MRLSGGGKASEELTRGAAAPGEIVSPRREALAALGAAVAKDAMEEAEAAGWRGTVCRKAWGDTELWLSRRGCGDWP